MMGDLGVIYTSWPVHKPFRNGRETERVKETEIEKEDKKIRKRERKNGNFWYTNLNNQSSASSLTRRTFSNSHWQRRL